jgi:hypothetical protein
MKAKDLVDKPPNILIYGPAGSGKTGLGAQAAGGYMMDFDDGMRTALTLQDKFTPLRQSIEFDIFKDRKPKEPRAFIDAKAKLLQISAQCAAGTYKYDAFELDSLTGLCRACQSQVMANAGDALKKPEILHWGIMVNEIENILTIIRSFNVLTIVTAHELLVETDDELLIRIMSVTKPHGLNKIPWLFDEVWHSKVRPAGGNKTNYIVSGRSTSELSVRTRSGFNTDVIHNEIGLVGVLEKIGFKYGKEETQPSTSETSSEASKILE